MEELIAEISEYADRRGIKPATVLQYGANLSGETWDRWCSGDSDCRMSTAKRLRDYMKSNPSKQPHSEGSL